MITDLSRQKTEQAKLTDHVFYLLPIFGGTGTPFGKGAAYLRRQSSEDIKTLAKSQLAGIKLLILAILWTISVMLMDRYVFLPFPMEDFLARDSYNLGIVRLPELLANGHSPTILSRWVSLYLELIRITLELAIFGHIIVACLRVLGFNVFRNTYKPLLATSIVEFWNRFYYYFKELLVQFFFYPTYLRTTWAGPKLRLYLSVFVAAFLGNMYFHLLDDFRHIVSLDFFSMWSYWGTRLVYCFALATGIWVSMIRQKDSRKEAWNIAGVASIRRIWGVWTFYALIHIWSIRNPDSGYVDRFWFTLSFFGIS